MNIGTHQTHCCVIHGCKYNDDNCPIERGIIRQEYLCEDCCDNWLPDKEIIKVKWKLIDKAMSGEDVYKMNKLFDSLDGIEDKQTFLVECLKLLG